jgi:hypothetical protein
MLVKICFTCKNKRSDFSPVEAKVCDRCKLNMKKWLLKNKEKHRIYENEKNKKWNKNNREKIRERERKQYREDINFKLKKLMRARIKIKNGYNSSIMNFSLENLKLCLEKQFDEKMSWNNCGKFWTIDHIIPISLYDLNNEKEFKKCCDLRNLRPLERKDNQIKWNKLNMKLVEEYNIKDLLPGGK